MLNDIIKIVENSSARIENGTLFCNNWTVSSIDAIKDLYDKGCIENNIDPDEIKIGDNINLELIISELCIFGFYDSYETFIAKNKYELHTKTYYIYESNDNQSTFVNKYNALQEFISSIKCIAKHLFFDVEILNAVIQNEKQSVVVCLDYAHNDVLGIDHKKLKELSNISTTLCNSENKEKKNLYVNELIDFVHSKQVSKLSQILEYIGELQENCENAYAFYISGFSSNKLKFEINTKALEYTGKIQTVINEAQTKLIAIPSAFVLAALTMDFDNNCLLFNMKNIVTTAGLFIFAILIQLFLSNQKSILEMIEADTDDFKKEFKDTNIELLSDKFKCVNVALKEQRKRLSIIQTLLWLIPSLPCMYWVFYYLLEFLFGIWFSK